MYNEQELINALKIMKNHCLQMDEDCTKCVLRNAFSDCAITNANAPSEWELKNDDMPRLILN